MASKRSHAQTFTHAPPRRRSGVLSEISCHKHLSHLEFEMANEIEERACNLLLIIVGYVTDQSKSQKQLS